MNRVWSRRRVLLLVFVTVGAAAAWFAYPFVSFDERFRRSRPQLEAYAARVRADGPPALANPPRWIGYFHVLKMEPLPHGFLFESDFGHPLDRTGLAYSTEPLVDSDPSVPDDKKQWFEHVEGY